jgi:hypothetical protein
VPAPSVTIVAVVPSQIFVGDTVTVTFDYSNAASYTINFGDGSGTHEFQLTGSSPESISSQPYPDSGTFSVVVVVTGPGGSATDSRSVGVQ